MYGLNIDRMVLGPIETNTYIVSNDKTGECVVIDPADSPEKIVDRLERNGLKPAAILLTHGHFDHIMAVNALKDRYDIPVYAHRDEAWLLANPAAGLRIHNLESRAVTEYSQVKHGDVLNLAGFRWKVIHTPGHSAGSVCYYIEDGKVIFSGDTLFRRSYGRTDLETGSYRDIVSSLKDRLFTIPEDEVRVLPGHGGSTDLGYEKKHNDILIDS